MKRITDRSFEYLNAATHGTSDAFRDRQRLRAREAERERAALEEATRRSEEARLRLVKEG